MRGIRWRWGKRKYGKANNSVSILITEHGGMTSVALYFYGPSFKLSTVRRVIIQITSWYNQPSVNMSVLYEFYRERQFLNSGLCYISADKRRAGFREKVDLMYGDWVACRYDGCRAVCAGQRIEQRRDD
jgi:hypothetical protein